MRHVLWVTMWACAAGGTPDDAPADAEDEPPPERSREVAASAAATPGSPTLTVTPTTVTAGEPVEVAFDRPGRNGCYRQTEVSTTVGEGTVTHAYTTSYTEGMCTMALVPGGFTTTWTPPTPGTWTGEVRVDDDALATYRVEVTAP